MGWLTDLIGTLNPGGKPTRRSIDQVEKALAKLASKETEAREARDRETRKHDELLLVDGSDALIVAADAAADKARLTLERIEKARPLLLSELASLRSEARRKRWDDLRQRYDKLARGYADIFRAAVEQQAEMIAWGDLARREGYEQEAVACFTPPARLVTPDSLNDYELALDRQADAQVVELNAATAPPAPKPPASPAKTPAKAAPVLKAVPPAPKPAPRAPIIETVAGEGQVLVVVLRTGLEVRGERWVAGDQIAVSAAEGEAALRAGAVDIPAGARLTFGAA